MMCRRSLRCLFFLQRRHRSQPHGGRAAKPCSEPILRAGRRGHNGAPGLAGRPHVYSLDQNCQPEWYDFAEIRQYGSASAMCCARRKSRLQGGWKFRVSAWVKTSNVVGDESGATICWNGETRRKMVGWHLSDGLKGDHDWQRIEAITRLPENAAACHVACYVREA